MLAGGPLPLVSITFRISPLAVCAGVLCRLSTRCSQSQGRVTIPQELFAAGARRQIRVSSKMRYLPLEKLRSSIAEPFRGPTPVTF